MVYALQGGFDYSVNNLFYENLQWKITKICASEILLICRDFNGHI